MRPPLPHLAVLASAVVLSGSALAAFSPPAQLVVVSDDAYPPYLFRTDEGKLQGIIVDKWQLWSATSGVPVKVEGMEWVKAQESVHRGAADVIDALVQTDARTKLYEFSSPYADVDARVFFHKSITGINDVASMRGFTIGAKDGSACAGWLAARGIETLRFFPTSDAVIEAARTREVPLFCMDLTAAQYFIFKLNLADEFRQTEPLYVARFHWAVAKGRTELRDFIQEGFGRVGADELKGIDAHWTGNPVSSPIDTRYFYYFSGVVAAILAGAALLVAWNRTLSARVSTRTAELRSTVRLLEESERRLAKVIEASPEAITIASIDNGTFVAVNPAAQRLSGYAREEMIGRSAVDMGFWPDLEERRRLIEDLQRSETVHGREFQLRRKDGKVRDALVSAALIDFEGRRLVLFQAIDITERKNAEKALQHHQELLRELSAHRDSVREAERARIAREIHDEMGQALTALRMDLSMVAKSAPGTSEQVKELKGRVDDIIQVVRDVATALRPAALDLGILAGIEWLVDEFQKRSGIRCRVSVADSEIGLAEDRAIVLFRILQESLTNIFRHADAHNVDISLRRDATHVRLDVKDDGKGFDPEAAGKKKTFGLLGIRERVIMLHGSVSITSVPGEGTQVSVSIPV